ncbi:(Fe-S)-binding protein [Desulfotalea psychrophila]|uniref:Glycolate oxidase iron-sulfur subunit n=1 Tax=Desulfotalea psychrophila (strain LSv54 / DSM 12343) TaxID=177439 RepID=Q6APH4_DESPS|nr:(Fe-S)-binding protein [Desulfotalea psychrophila]CAG35750.1 related to glycolate oxidase, iron-sulfur subunit (GlcF) [Desulfotalea psychrophila LSv54]
MSDLKKLADQLMELDDQMASCMKCGMCQAVCPVFAETMHEGDVTRGKIALLEQLAREMIKDSDQVNEKLTKCLLCGSCAAACPSGVHIMDIFINARVIVTTYKGLHPLKKIIFRGFLTRPKLFDFLTLVSAQFQNIFVHKEDAAAATNSCSLLTPLLGKRHFGSLAKRPFRLDYPQLDTPAGKSGVKIAFFPGCVVDKMSPHIGHAAMKIFKHHGVGVFLPKGQACCGIPTLASGETKAFIALMRQNVQAFDNKDFDYIITPCGTCTDTIKELWIKMIDDEDAIFKEKVTRLAAKAMDINEFIVNVLGVKEPAEKPVGGKVVTYHDPCHLAKSLKVTSQPRTLLKLNPSYEFKEMTDANKCCGNGGTFNLFHYDLSKQIGMHKADNIRAVKADVVSTGCPACMMQLADVLSQSGGGVEVRHVIEIYAESLP